MKRQFGSGTKCRPTESVPASHEPDTLCLTQSVATNEETQR